MIKKDKDVIKIVFNHVFVILKNIQEDLLVLQLNNYKNKIKIFYYNTK